MPGGCPTEKGLGFFVNAETMQVLTTPVGDQSKSIQLHALHSPLSLSLTGC